MDWPSFLLGFSTASALAAIIAAAGYVLEQRKRARDLFKSEAPSGKRTRKLRAREIDPLVDDTKDPRP